MFWYFYAFFMGVIWTVISYQAWMLFCILSFKGGPYDQKSWNKRWLKKLTLVYWKWQAKKNKGRVVLLLDFEQKVYISIARPSRSLEGVLRSWVYWPNKIGAIELHEDGTVTREGNRYYIHNWLPLDRDDRTWMVLTHDALNFDLVVV